MEMKKHIIAGLLLAAGQANDQGGEPVIRPFGHLSVCLRWGPRRRVLLGL
jgi:hypothetical protein